MDGYIIRADGTVEDAPRGRPAFRVAFDEETLRHIDAWVEDADER